MEIIAFDLEREYRSALQEYLAAGEEANAQRAHDVGRRALEAGKGRRELALVHRDALVAMSRSIETHYAGLERIASFFAETLLPIDRAEEETVHGRGSRSTRHGPHPSPEGRRETTRESARHGSSRPTTSSKGAWAPFDARCSSPPETTEVDPGSGSRETLETLASVARMLVDLPVDGCRIDLLGEREPETARRLVVLRAPAGAASGWVRWDARKGRPPAEVLDVVAAQTPDTSRRLGPARLVSMFADIPPLPEGVSFRSLLIVPLRARGRTFGAVTLMRSEPGQGYRAEDLHRAQELVRPCALAIDNARRLEAMATAHERGDRERDDAVSTLSHELKNFVTPIVAWARALARDCRSRGTAELADGLRSIESNAQALSALIEPCLGLSDDSPGARVERDAVDLTRIARTGGVSMGKTALAKGLELELRLADSALWVRADPTKLAQVLMNLLTNAIKYTEPGGKVSITSRAADGKAVLEVSDTGRGLSPELLGELFEPCAARRRDASASLGIGLGISHEIVESYGGCISAESGGRMQGSTFRVELPLSVPPPVVVEAAARRPAAVSAARRLLLVEDTRDILELMKLEMERLGYVVLTASDGRSGLEAALRELPDVIVSDIKIPEMDGLELIRRMRRIPSLASTPAIALTGLGMKKDVEQALASGYHAHVPKPVDAGELSAIIQSLAGVGETHAGTVK